jgi:formylglycine-generating enzyme required for sulfatase activity
MEKYPVTQGQYLAVMGSNPSHFSASNGYPDELTLPVEQVKWVDATNYCALRTAQEKAAGLIPTNYFYRLPTEAEWEYVRRAGTTTAFYFGSGLHSGQANFNGLLEYDAVLGEIPNPNGIWLKRTTPVGSYPPNAWGFYDMIGNVFEWCLDWWGDYPHGSVTDPQGPVTGDFRVLRGGCHYSDGYVCRAAERRCAGPTDDVPDCIGFRVVLARQRLEQFPNASLPMLVTVSGMV